MSEGEPKGVIRGSIVPIIGVCALLAAGGSALGQTGPCGLDVQVSGGGMVAARGLTGTVDADLTAEIGPAGSYVVLENSCIQAEYEPYFENHSQFGMRHLYIKGAGNEDQICSNCGFAAYIGGGAGRGILESASIVWDRPERKTVRFTWWDKYGNPQNRVIEEVSIYPDSCFLQTDHIDVKYSNNIVDLGAPGGTVSGAHVAHGAADWVRGYVTHDYSPTVGAYYNRYPPDGVNDPEDAGSLNYDGHFIVGVYNPANGRGFGRAIPVADISILKLLLRDDLRRGLELFPYPFYVSHEPFTGFLYTVTGGETEMLSLGRELVDSGAGSHELACGDSIEVEAKPHSGWAFDYWSGSLSGSANPTTLTLSALDTVTAVFAMDYAVYAEDFETYAAGADPDDWLDTAAGSSLDEEDSFEVVDLGDTLVLGTSSTAINIHSHYTATETASWSSYEYSGRMRLTDTGGGVGVTFLSQFPSSNRYYRLRRGNFGGGRTFHISPAGTTIAGGISDTGVTPLADTWYRFRVEAQDTGARMEIRAKVWPDAGEEPPDWQVDCYDDSPSRIVAGTVGVWSMSYGEKQWDELAVRHVERALSEDFNAYAAGADPVDWLDTGSDSSLVENDSLFQTYDVNGEMSFGTTSALSNIHSHYVGAGSAAWSSYTYTGRLILAQSDGGIGITFLSDYPNSDTYYRLRRYGSNAFHISPHGTSITGGVTDTGVVPVPNTWYWFTVEVQDTGTRTEIRAKVWADGTAEPPWQVDCYDDSGARITSGTVGIWSVASGAKYWDDLVVTTGSGFDCDEPGEACDDGDPCTVNDTCVNGLCTGVLVDCSAWGDACNMGVCNPGTGLCEAQPTNEGGACEDGVFCNGEEICLDGTCVDGAETCQDDCEQCNEGTDTCDWCILDLDQAGGVIGTGDFGIFSGCFGLIYPPGHPSYDDCLASNFDDQFGEQACGAGSDPDCYVVGTGDFGVFSGCFALTCGECANCWVSRGARDDG